MQDAQDHKFEILETFKYLRKQNNTIGNITNKIIKSILSKKL